MSNPIIPEIVCIISDATGYKMYSLMWQGYSTGLSQARALLFNWDYVFGTEIHMMLLRRDLELFQGSLIYSSEISVWAMSHVFEAVRSGEIPHVDGIISGEAVEKLITKEWLQEMSYKLNKEYEAVFFEIANRELTPWMYFKLFFYNFTVYGTFNVVLAFLGHWEPLKGFIVGILEFFFAYNKHEQILTLTDSFRHTPATDPILKNVTWSLLDFNFFCNEFANSKGYRDALLYSISRTNFLPLLEANVTFAENPDLFVRKLAKLDFFTRIGRGSAVQFIQSINTPDCLFFTVAPDYVVNHWYYPVIDRWGELSTFTDIYVIALIHADKTSVVCVVLFTKVGESFDEFFSPKQRIDARVFSNNLNIKIKKGNEYCTIQ